MIKIEADTLEEAYKKDSSELNCSFTELNYEIVQHPKSGFLGFGKKSAVIVATMNKTVADIDLKNDMEVNKIPQQSEKAPSVKIETEKALKYI